MKKSNLYQIANCDKEHILLTLRAVYASQILTDLTRLTGSADKDRIERILETVYARLPEIPPECDVSLLVTDCVRCAAGLTSQIPEYTSQEPHENPDPMSLSAIGERLRQLYLSRIKYSIPLACILILITLLLIYFF